MLVHIIAHIESKCKVFGEKYFKSYEIVVLCKNIDITEEIKSITDDTVITVVKFGQNISKDKALQAGKALAIGDFIYEFETVNVDYSIEKLFLIYKQALDKGMDIVELVSKKKTITTKIRNLIYKKIRGSYSFENVIVRIISRRAINRIEMILNKRIYRNIEYAICGLTSGYIECETDANHSKMEKHFDAFFLYSNVLNYFIALSCLVFTIVSSIITVLIFKGVKLMMLMVLAEIVFFVFGGALIMIFLNYLKLLMRSNYVTDTQVYSTIERISKN